MMWGHCEDSYGDTMTLRNCWGVVEGRDRGWKELSQSGMLRPVTSELA